MKLKTPKSVSEKGENNSVDKIFHKYSLRFKLTLTLTILIIVTIFFVWYLNKTWLDDYYLHTKIKTLGDAYNEVNRIFEEKEENEELTTSDLLRIEKYRENKNINIHIFTEKLRPVYYYFEKDVEERIYTVLQDYIFFNKNPKTEIGSTNNYYLFTYYDTRIESKYVDLLGNLDNKYIIFIRTNFESIQDSVTIANKFLAYVGILSVLIGTVVMFYISKKFTTPILQLAGIAKKMSDLDFDIKYDVKTRDEIGELGGSINILSEKLECTISELKSANNELLSDIQDKIQIDEMRKDFLSNVTHELKTPIALIQGYAEGLMDNINDDSDSREFYCEVIIDEAKKMNEMVKKLLSLNQIEFGKNQVNMKRFDIVSLIQSVLESTEILFQQKGVRLLFDPSEPVYVWADEFMVEEVVTNYISNALNHVDGSKIIEVKLINKDDVLRVAVFNTGSNIPEEELDKIWIKFYKVDKARTREYGGSGIGLSIVKAIMTSLNQECGVINHNMGVEFWFELDTK